MTSVQRGPDNYIKSPGILPQTGQSGGTTGQRRAAWFNTLVSSARERLQRLAPTRVSASPVDCRPLEGIAGILRLVCRQLTVAQLCQALREREAAMPGLRDLRLLYEAPRVSPHMSDFRVGPNPFDQIPLDWIILVEKDTAKARGRLVAHGITARIRWNGTKENLPKGWQASVRQVYAGMQGCKPVANTLVGLFIRVEDAFRESGYAAKCIDAMRSLAQADKLEHLIIPLRLPQRFLEQNALLSFADFALSKREDGQYVDHWLRIHVRMGAKVLLVSEFSHQHALALDDLTRMYRCPRPIQAGSNLVEQNGEWFNAQVDPQLGCAVINQGCVWVEHCLG